MYRPTAWLALLIAAGVLIAGCSSPKPAEAPQEKPQATSQAAEQPKVESKPAANPGNEVSQVDMEMAQSTLIVYFDAVVAQDQAMLTFLTVGNPAVVKRPVPLKGSPALIEEIKPLKGIVVESRPTVYFEVKVDLGENPGGDWNSGVNHRWAVVQKTIDGWKVKEITTSPPNI